MMRLVLGIAIASVVLVGATAALASVITKTSTTKTYKLTLDVGPVEAMYTQAEVKAKHPTTGEVMLGGSMGGMGGMSMSSGNRHLEVHVASRSTGKPLAVPPSSITLTDQTMSMGMSDKVNAVAMEGVGQGMADLHYGDNVKLTAGHAYKVVVTVKGEKATFGFKA